MILASDSPIEVDAQIADISLTLVLRPFGPRERKTERTRLAELEQVQAGFLGYLLDTLALILGLDDYTPVVLPRLAEFAAVGARAEGVLWPDGAFADAYARARLANSPAISYVLRFGFAPAGMGWDGDRVTRNDQPVGNCRGPLFNSMAKRCRSTRQATARERSCDTRTRAVN